MKLPLIGLALIMLSACVEHRGTVSLEVPPDDTLKIHVYKDGAEVKHLEPLSFQSPMPGEIHLDAWYRDASGHFHRSHERLQSPRPWWQRFPFDMASDALWPDTITVSAESTARFEANKRLTKQYLDEMAAVHRLKTEK